MTSWRNELPPLRASAAPLCTHLSWRAAGDSRSAQVPCPGMTWGGGARVAGWSWRGTGGAMSDRCMVGGLPGARSPWDSVRCTASNSS